METKREFRNKILKIRNSMEKHDVIEKSDIIISKLMNLDIYKTCKVVFVYMDFKNEVMTSSLIKQLLLENKRVVIPYTDTVNTVLIPSELKNMEQDLVVSNYGYYEPKFENIVPVRSEEFDLVVVPGVVFDKNLNRIGFGKGYYDRILSRLKPSAKAVAVAYEFQVLDEVPSEIHDIKMDMILTEQNIYN